MNDSEFLIQVVTGAAAGAVVTAFVGVLITLRNLFRKLRAERQVVSYLSSHADVMKQIQATHLEKDPLSAERLHSAKLVLQEAMKHIDANARGRVNEGLSQPSLKGQADYVLKLFTEAMTRFRRTHGPDSGAAPYSATRLFTS
jgi:hypothetical protein